MEIAKKLLAGPDLVSVLDHNQQIAALESEKNKLEVNLAKQIPEINFSRLIDHINYNSVAEIIPTGSALIELTASSNINFKANPSKGDPYFTEQHYISFVVSKNNVAELTLIDLGPCSIIDNLINQYRAIVNGKDLQGNRYTSRKQHVSDMQQLGTKLRECIFDPLIPAFHSCKTIYLSPDNEITKLPFEILPIDNNKQLLDIYEITYLSVGRDIMNFNKPSTGDFSKPIVFADPDFDLKIISENSSTGSNKLKHVNDHFKDISFKRLNETKLEGETISKMLGITPILGERALERIVKNVKSPRFLHFATHGFFLKNREENKHLNSLDIAESFICSSISNPMLRSGLALAGANTWAKGGQLPIEAEDGILTAEDVSCLDLLDTELVVLSACETGLGETCNGEGVFGLRRAFNVAGAKRLVLSLWAVPDQATKELMVAFYEYFLSGLPCNVALHKAQLKLREVYPNPCFWGAFILQGDPSPIKI
ncbi:MAG: CHAT domain-containing protein [Crenarchaeota archaeon]|nr:CHAT domain-containing protein [Thermoproteota archaeon]